MATWGLHIRIAEEILKEHPQLNVKHFLVGNIGADCGVPNEDWSTFEPPSEISHWSTKGKSGIQPDRFYDALLLNQDHSPEDKAFYLGYYVHLLTDIAFHQLIMDKVKNDPLYAPFHQDKSFIWTAKEDWYDLDHLYFKEHPESLFHTVFQHITDFPDYMDYYPKGAILRQIKYITDYYQHPSDHLYREYKYLTADEMSHFLNETTQLILSILYTKDLLPKKHTNLDD